MNEYIRTNILNNDNITIINISFIITLENNKNVITNIVNVNISMDMLEPVKKEMKLIFRFFLFFRLINPAITKDASNKKIVYPINTDMNGV